MKCGYRTTEFWAIMLGMVIVALLLAATWAGMLKPVQPEIVEQAFVAFLLGAPFYWSQVRSSMKKTNGFHPEPNKGST